MDNFRRGTSDGDRPAAGSDWTTLPGNFKRNGYFVAGTGKTFHPGDPYQFDYPYSWSFDEFPYGFGGTATKGHPEWKNTTSDHIWCDNKTVVCAGGETGCPDTIKVEGGAFWCSIDTTKLPVMPDGSKQLLWDQAEVVLAKERLQHAANLQRQAKGTTKPNRPFFVAVGFHRPRNHCTDRSSLRVHRIHPFHSLKIIVCGYLPMSLLRRPALVCAKRILRYVPRC